MLVLSTLLIGSVRSLPWNCASGNFGIGLGSEASILVFEVHAKMCEARSVFFEDVHRQGIATQALVRMNKRMLRMERDDTINEHVVCIAFFHCG